MNKLETLLIHNPLRWQLQKHYEIKTLKKLGYNPHKHITNKNIYELGTATHHHPKHLLQYNPAHITATDLKPIKRIPPTPKITNIQVNIIDQPQAFTNLYDTTFTFGVLHHIQDWQKAIQETFRTQKYGGFYILDDFTKQSLQKWYHRPFDNPMTNRFTADELLHQMEKTGYKIINHTTHLYGDIIFIIAQKPC